ncbi:hypothetical protein SDC9_153739 [bioreactor metagenome]|uniref:Uncharacterized protein n=1 Tax=bioreactor metagenome TaxID=1076179 RepID=A0A645F1F3_9ZZZZ
MRHLADLVVGQPERADLILGQLVSDHAGDFFHAKRLRGLVPGVAADDLMVPVDHQRHQEAELPDAGRDALHGFVVFARVAGIRVDVGEPDVLNPHVNLRSSTGKMVIPMV